MGLHRQPTRAWTPAYAGPAIELQEVHRRYGSIQALQPTSLSIHRGEVVALLGPNGAGKSTLVNMVLGLLAPTGGAVKVFGQSPLEAAHRIHTGAMMQQVHLAANLRVSELVELFSSYYPAPLKVADTLERAGLTALAGRTYRQLSGGQRQRVRFALALCGDPALMVMDEPTVALDTETRRAFWMEVRRLVDDGRTVLLTTHYLEEADALADRILVIDKGRLVAQATPQELKARVNVQHVSLRTVLSDPQLMAVAGVRAVRRQADTVHLTVDGTAVIAPLLYALDPALQEFTVRPASLEDVFQGLHAPQGVSA
ncbi:ATP-binding cassette domain-containing protein [Deinococcus sp. HMF7620]|uniref:ATP-binding cassette domain-containing protein n=1 Tax=Deinococcus arboris TaxID=2682977 RepID=A0A7C9HR80_9DEIO|nr:MULTISPECIES: ABC transporter ATP-binding protein [Deinococcus]MBZ9751408.1 ABC transporter ATP-binding protein [Deinococcus betulae]MVN86633.1 ATP-binding cassette domain-containing protein [Deinococcus arboris]